MYMKKIQSTHIWSLQTFKHSPLDEGKRHSRHLGLVSHSLHLCCHLRSSRHVHGQNTAFTRYQIRIGWKKHWSVSARQSCFSQFQHRSCGMSDIESLEWSKTQFLILIAKSFSRLMSFRGWVFRALKLRSADIKRISSARSDSAQFVRVSARLQLQRRCIMYIHNYTHMYKDV